MKIFFALSTFIIGFAYLSQVHCRGLIGASECTWGPSYWCSNITNAKHCNAVTHCIQTVWEKQKGVEDDDSICKICLDMVKEARDQLESNETQSDIKDVLDGSCRLIPIKPVQKECIKLMDDFAPELVEALASQMNPQVVCSVAGLCNNVEIDNMLERMNKENILKKKIEIKVLGNSEKIKPNKLLSCDDCSEVSSIIVEKFHKTSRDDFLDSLLNMCGLFSSFSDACSSIVLTNFDTIYFQLQNELTAKNVCHLSGVCAVSLYHQHEKPDNSKIEIKPMSSVGVVPHPNSEKNLKDNIPCELCEQLVTHLRDVLIANTTESEFKQVMEGFCKQTKNFKDECLSIVDQYYDVIYNTLVNNLDPNGACFMMGLCPKGSKLYNFENRPIIPLVESKKVLGSGEPKFSKEEIASFQLPIDKLMGAPNAAELVENGELCTICEYFLHFVQEALATPANEDKIKEVVSSTCNKLPKAVQSECHNFVDMYGDAIIALLIQNIDPSEICPKLKLCPENVKDMEVFIPQTIEINSKSTAGDKPTCALCLFAVTQVQQMIKGNKTKEHIQEVLDNLCSHMNKKLKGECINFVNTYSEELIDKLINDLKPQEICEYLKLCPESEINGNIQIIHNTDQEVLTNEIIDDTKNGVHYSYDVENIECKLCKSIIEETENKIMNKNKTKETIISALEKSCEAIHQIKRKCRNYVDKYGNTIAELILDEIAPEEICRRIFLCLTNINIDNALNIEVTAIPAIEKNENNNHDESSSEEDLLEFDDEISGSQECVLCEFIMLKLENELKNKKTQEEIKQTVHGICKKMPKTISQSCDKFIDKYADLIIALVDTVPPKQICARINLCATNQFHIDANEELIECGVCHGAVLALYPMVKDKTEINTENIINDACNSDEIPPKYYNKCSDLIAYYGESIFNLIKRNTDLSDICQEIGKCFITENPIHSYNKLGNGVINRRKRSTNKNVIVGAQKCTWGPSYWCENHKQADECNAKSWCIEKKQGFAAV